MSDKKEKQEIIVTGFGGQGIILAGRIIGMAAALRDDKESTLVQSYGPESRGGACCAQVVISNTIIQYPYITTPDILACMSQSAYEKYYRSLKPGGFLLTDKDLVIPQDDRLCFAIPATRMAEELGRKMMANIIMVGFTTAVTNLVTKEAALFAVTSSVPKGTEKMNTKAFNLGFDYGLSKLKGLEKRAGGQTGAKNEA
ncbi:2-oxoglutarate ferredoxin oxidoreductase, gamma subunit [Desulfocicer vacuolatum DSM 3385]|uniref:2-oxoglutarate ferredoxin oxidoreductase, gamma subunit n=1 Tax=Desulfocicer vacuolatum DSM 3385 TaxID=1121400 RepID=A0A1W2E6K9_9BACT|nr:2-oxoacid:acceptor oxidoreductase family protein [Desulfocicer vacuolatum]SMD05381.1 2-oxoglutarate ferredoxin oxidoreductase, gamma subunit [Desulfocicer vacuolatum DSM 3385]